MMAVPSGDSSLGNVRVTIRGDLLLFGHCPNGGHTGSGHTGLGHIVSGHTDMGHTDLGPTVSGH